jgi:hypothetical protein
MMEELDQQSEIKQIITLKDMEPFGIEALTGEACGYGLRELCDLNEDGAKYLREFFSLADNAFLPPWNSHGKYGKHVASILIGHHSFDDIAIFLLLKHHLWVVGAREGTFAADTEEELDAIRKWHHPFQTYFNNNWSSRNQHAMSGRLE